VNKSGKTEKATEARHFFSRGGGKEGNRYVILCPKAGKKNCVGDHRLHTKRGERRAKNKNPGSLHPSNKVSALSWIKKKKKKRRRLRRQSAAHGIKGLKTSSRIREKGTGLTISKLQETAKKKEREIYIV